MNNGFSNQNISKTAQNPARFFKKDTLAHSLKSAGAWRYEKDRSLENIAHFMSKRVGKRVCDMIQSPSF